MDNFEIKKEDSDIIFVDITEESESDCIVVEDDKDEVELLEVIPVKTNKNECGYLGGKFETVFLPNIYGDVAVETPFFDISLYKKNYSKKYKLMTEDEINKSNEHWIINSNEHIIHHGTGKQKEINKIRHENESSIYSPFIISNSEVDNRPRIRNEYDGNTPTYSSDNVEDNIIQYFIQNKNQRNYQIYQYENTVKSQEGCLLINDECPDIQIQSQELFDQNINKYQCDYDDVQPAKSRNDNNYNQSFVNKELIPPCKPIEVGNYKCPKCKTSKPFDTLQAVNNHLKFVHFNSPRKLNEDGKYKCPKCKRKTFDTLLAINNHLKFEHISFLNTKTIEDAKPGPD